MKEKTFEELIEPLKIGGFEGWYSVEFISTGKVKELLQQVREATKAEVLKLCDDNFFSKEPKGKLMENIENLPTDRIKITDENEN